MRSTTSTYAPQRIFGILSFNQLTVRQIFKRGLQYYLPILEDSDTRSYLLSCPVVPMHRMHNRLSSWMMMMGLHGLSVTAR
jgi:hypothetical protein